MKIVIAIVSMILFSVTFGLQQNKFDESKEKASFKQRLLLKKHEEFSAVAQNQKRNCQKIYSGVTNTFQNLKNL